MCKITKNRIQIDGKLTTTYGLINCANQKYHGVHKHPTSSNSHANSISSSTTSSIFFGLLQPSLTLLGHFLFTKINFSSLSICNLHSCRFVRIATNGNICFVSIWNPTTQPFFATLTTPLWEKWFHVCSTTTKGN